MNIFEYIANYGFPAVVAMYLLIRLEKRIEDLKDSIDRLNNNITQNQKKRIN